VKIAAIPQVLPSNPTGESVPSKRAGVIGGSVIVGFDDKIDQALHN
jgi:hypothetical protein